MAPQLASPFRSLAFRLSGAMLLISLVVHAVACGDEAAPSNTDQEPGDYDTTGASDPSRPTIEPSADPNAASLEDGGWDGGKGGDGGADAGKQDAGRTDAGTMPLRARKYLCINGAGTAGPGGRNTGGNPDFETVCGRLGPSLVKACSSGTCFSTFQFEATGIIQASRTALVAALDTNNDGRVTGADADVDVVLLGYSWGGTNVRDMAEWMRTDAKFDDSRRRVAIMMTFDPYRPFKKLDIPANVAEYVEYRHSVAPAGDCSIIKAVGVKVSGPYLGIVPRCTGTSKCLDYDYSTAPNTFFPTLLSPGRGYIGSKVDHCGIVSVAASAALPYLGGVSFSPLPPVSPVARY
jgi:hypothetical protein